MQFQIMVKNFFWIHTPQNLKFWWNQDHKLWFICYTGLEMVLFVGFNCLVELSMLADGTSEAITIAWSG